MNDKLKVLLVSPYGAKKTGGIGTWSKIVLDYSACSNDIDLVFFNTATKLPKRQAMDNRIAHLIVGGIDSLRILLCLLWKMLVARPDVVHYTSSAASALRKDLVAIWIVKRIFHKRFVIHWHFGRIPEIFKENDNEKRLFVKVCNRVDGSIVIDESSFKVLQKEQIKSVYIPNPIPVALQREAEGLDVNKVSAARNEGEVLFVGHVLKGKGIYELIQACMACEKVKRLIVVGPFFDEQLRQDIVTIASKRDNGNWLLLAGEKNREEVWNYYKTCSIFCLPSYTEGFPYVVLEAMSFACPIVATKVGAIPEMLSDGCGELIDARQVEPLRHALESIIINTNVANSMGEKAHEKVLSDFVIEKVFSRYYNLWISN